MAAIDEPAATDTVTIWSRDGIPWPTEVTISITGLVGEERWEGRIVDSIGPEHPESGSVTVHLSDGRRARATFSPEHDPELQGVEPFHRPDGLAI